jgi:hypothetical protein
MFVLTSANTLKLGTSVVSKKNRYVNNYIQGKVEELFGTDHLVVTVAKKNTLIHSKVMADIFEARIAYFWHTYGPNSPILLKIVEQIIVIMDFLRGRKKKELAAFIEAYHKGRYFHDTPLGIHHRGVVCICIHILKNR